VLLEQTDARYAEIVALCDINPAQLQLADKALADTGKPPARHYESWKEMLAKERLEAVVVAVPLFLHADVTVAALEAGHHVLCEKMMAWDVEGCHRMADTARRTGRLLEIGHQRHYNPVYQAAYEGIVKAGQLGEVYHSRLVWHRNGSWRREVTSPAPGYDPSRWGYPSLEQLINWRLYFRYSRGLLAELASHQVAIADWFFGGPPVAAIGSGGVYRYQDGREVPDHVYVTRDARSSSPRSSRTRLTGTTRPSTAPPAPSFSRARARPTSSTRPAAGRPASTSCPGGWALWPRPRRAGPWRRRGSPRAEGGRSPSASTPTPSRSRASAPPSAPGCP